MTAGPSLPDRRQVESGAAPGGHSLRRNVVYAVGGMGIFYASQFVVIVLLAKFAPPDVLGQVEFSLAIATPIVLFCSLELRGALVADAANEFTFGTYRRLRSLTMTMAGVVLMGVAVWQAPRQPGLAYSIILVGMFASRIILSLAEIDWGIFQKRERLDLMAFSAGVRGLAMVAAFGALLPAFSCLRRLGAISAERAADGAALAVIIYALASVAWLLAFDRRQVAARADHDPDWTWPAVGHLARQTLPLGLVLLILHLCNSIPILLIEPQENGKAAVGHFGALSRLTLAGSLVVLQAANAAANRLAHAYQSDLRAFLRLAGKLLALALAVGLPLLLITLLFGEWLLRVLYRPDYATYFPEFKIIVLAQCLALLTVVFGVVTTQMRLFWLQVPAQLLVLASTAVAAWLLIPGGQPVRGGAWTVLIRSSVHVVLYAGCVLAGILLRPWLLARQVRPTPTAPPAKGPDVLPGW